MINISLVIPLFNEEESLSELCTLKGYNYNPAFAYRPEIWAKKL
jgi:hypothetical protein